jgi:hypothetical protein
MPEGYTVILSDLYRMLTLIDLIFEILPSEIPCALFRL